MYFKKCVLYKYHCGVSKIIQKLLKGGRVVLRKRVGVPTPKHRFLQQVY